MRPWHPTVRSDLETLSVLRALLLPLLRRHHSARPAPWAPAAPLRRAGRSALASQWDPPALWIRERQECL